VEHRLPLSSVDVAVVIAVAFCAMVVGTLLGVVLGDGYFVYGMVALSVFGIFLVVAFAPKVERTRPRGGTGSAALPVVALVVACSGIAVVGIALGHLARNRIASRGGAGERIAFAALVTGYSVLAVEVVFCLWLITMARQGI
jgi:hypothetical protein